MKKLFYKLLSLFPQTLPVGIAEFEVWADSIIGLLGKGFEAVPRDDLHFVIATIIMHLGPQRSLVPKNYFVRSLRKGAANQVAGQVFSNIKEKQKVAQETAKTAVQQSPAEAPALQGASNGTQG
jgi:hypothetical protein